MIERGGSDSTLGCKRFGDARRFSAGAFREVSLVDVK
jgi:hypothetical protein